MSTPDLSEQLATADRLQVITQRIGFAFWQAQELEGVAATCLVLLTQEKPGLGLAAGMALLQKALRQPFGITVKQIVKAGLLSADVGARLEAVLSERNWLVHRSKSTNRDAVHSDGAAAKLLRRVDAIADESGALIKELVALSVRHGERHGITEVAATDAGLKLLEQWHQGDNA